MDELGFVGHNGERGGPHPERQQSAGSSGNGSAENDMSEAFFDHALLETLFYNEMMEIPTDDLYTDASGSGGGDDPTAAEVEAQQPQAPQQAPQHVQEQSQQSNAFSYEQEQQQPIADGQTHPRGATLHSYHGAATTAAIPVEKANPGPGAVAVAPQLTSCAGDSSSCSAGAGAGAGAGANAAKGNTGLDIASLQETYRRGVAAAAALSQHPLGRHTIMAADAEPSSGSGSTVPTPVSAPVPLPGAQSQSHRQPRPVPAAIPLPVTQTQQPPAPTPGPPQQSVAQVHNMHAGDAASLPHSGAPQLPRVPPQMPPQPHPAQPRAAIPNAASVPPFDGADAKQRNAVGLVSQFATLASRLGISLPRHVLASLTTAAVMQEEKQQVADGQAVAQNEGIDDGRPTPPAVDSMVGEGTNGTARPHKAAQVQPPKGLNAGAGTQVLQPGNGNPPRQPQRAVTAMIPPTSTVAGSNAAKPPPIATPIPAPPPVVGPTAKQIEDTAAAAVEAVESNRYNGGAGGAANPVSDGAEATPLTTAATHGHRKRKRNPRVDECEAKLASLKEENLMLRRHLDTVLRKTATFDAERAKGERAMREMVNNTSATEDEVRRMVSKFTEMYSDYGRCRRQELHFHLDQLQKLAAPNTFTKMTLWTLGQKSDFFQDPKRNSLGNILRSELQITPAQAKKIVERRHKIQTLSANIRQTLVLLDGLRALCEHKQRLFSDRMNKCQEILTPLQVVRLLIWIDDNSPVLEAACPGWGSERIRAGNAKGAGEKKQTGAGSNTASAPNDPTADRADGVQANGSNPSTITAEMEPTDEVDHAEK